MDEKKPPMRVTGVAEAMAYALQVQSDPTNRAVHCECGAVFLSGAARKNEKGQPLCFGCGKAAT